MRCFSEILESWKGVGQTVQRVLQDILTDCSTEDKFEFSIVCEECGKVWKSKAIAFSKARIHPVTEGKKVVYAALYQREKKEAHLKALKAGEKLFSRCPICHRWVCDDCFMGLRGSGYVQAVRRTVE